MPRLWCEVGRFGNGIAIGRKLFTFFGVSLSGARPWRKIRLHGSFAPLRLEIRMSESVQPGRRPWATSEIISWVVILVAVALVMWAVARRHVADAAMGVETSDVHEAKMDAV